MADPQDRKGEAGRAVASFNQRRGMCRKEEEEAKEGRKKNRDDDIEKGAKTTARLAGGWRTRKWVNWPPAGGGGTASLYKERTK